MTKTGYKNLSKSFDDFFDKLQYVDWEISQNITQTFKSADLNIAHLDEGVSVNLFGTTPSR